MKHRLQLRVGPAVFRVGSAWEGPITALRKLYAAYPDASREPADFTVRLLPTEPWRQWARPSIFISGDHWLADAAPMALAHGLLAAEMGMNLQMALGWRRHLLLHASSVEKNGRVLLMSGDSGSGKSTMAALLGERGWRLLGDEFALIDLVDGSVVPFPRLVSLKNASVDAVRSVVSEDRLGPLMAGTAKGDIRHLIPNAEAIAGMDRPGMPALLVFPGFGRESGARPVEVAESFIRLTHASTNYVALGEAGFRTLTSLVERVPAVAIDYASGDEGIAMIEELWSALP